MNNEHDHRLERARNIIQLMHGHRALHTQAQMLKEAIEAIATATGVDLSPIAAKYRAQLEEHQRELNANLEELDVVWRQMKDQ